MHYTLKVASYTRYTRPALSRFVQQQRASRSSTRNAGVMAAAQASDSFMILQYDYVSDILEKRGPHREGHLAAAKAVQEQGKLVMAGAYGSDILGGMFIFKNATKEEIEQYVKDDPYTQNGLITGYKVHPYMVAVRGE